VSGGAAGSGNGGSGGQMIDPLVSRYWTWEECGRIPGDPDRGPRAVAASPESPFAVTTGDGSVLIHPYDLTAPTVLHGAVDDPPLGLGYSRDGALLAEARDNTVIWDVAGTAIVSEIVAPDSGCRGERLTFSEESDYVLRYGNDDSCIFSTLDGELVGRLPGLLSAAFRGTEVIGAGCVAEPGELCVYALDGAEQRRIVLAAPSFISPAVAPLGDAIVGATSSEIFVWEPVDGALRWFAPRGSGFTAPIFTPSGDRFVIGDQLYEVSDGAIVSEAVLAQGAIALLESGELVLTSRPAIFDLLGNSRRVFAANSAPIMSLRISRDDSVLAAIANGETFVWQVADDFSRSNATFSLQAEGAINVDVSADARWVAISGDVRAVTDAATGRLVWRDDAFDPGANVACLGGELRFSPDGRLLVGKRYQTTVDVFDATAIHSGPDAPAPAELLTRFDTRGCGQGIAFSTDGSEFATPEGLFKTSDFPPPVDPPTTSRTPFPDSRLTFLEAPPDGGPYYLVTVCDPDPPCRYTIHESTLGVLESAEGGRHPRYSSEGHWIVSAGKLVNTVYGTVHNYDENATEAIFAPNGDVIAGERDGSLVRFCRRN
jgi:hypothetical protein